METYINSLIDKLCKMYGYNVVEFENIPGLLNNWGAFKKMGNAAEVIFFTDEYGENILINRQKFIKLLKSSLQCEHIRLIQVLVSAETNNKINPQCELIFINSVDKKIVYYTPGLESKVNEISSCINYMNQSTVKNKKTEVSIITYILIAVNILAYILTSYLSSNIFDSNKGVLIFLGAKVNYLITAGEYYRLITCMFLHGGIVHLAFNMYALYSLGPFIENVYGKTKYLIIYFVAGIISSIFSYIFSTSVSVGASGAIFGLFGAALVFALKMRDRVGKSFITNITSVILINLFMGFSMTNVDNFGHLGGLIGGIAITTVLGIWKDY